MDGDTQERQYPNIPQSWLEKINEKLGQLANCIITVRFVDRKEIWTDCTERTFGDQKDMKL